jgi:predicted dehydrogenase
VAGSEGVLEWIYTSEELTLITNDQEPQVVELDEKMDLFANFVASVYGDAEPWTPAEDCLRMTEVCLRLREAANSGEVADLS